jgi:pyruvate kinase
MKSFFFFSTFYPNKLIDKNFKQIAREAESAIFHKELFESLRTASLAINDNVNSIAIAAVQASFHSKASAIIVLTTSG